MRSGGPSLSRAFESPAEKLAYNRRLFTTIAPRYDLITRALSYGQDARWKRRVTAIVRAEGPRGRLLDLACGTGDIALSLVGSGRAVVGLDLTTAMLRLARRRAGPESPLWLAGDMTCLPFSTGSFDVVTTGYGLRNVPHLDMAIAEIARVLRRGGLFVSLDFNQPPSRVMRALSMGYLTILGSMLGLLLHRDADTYRYIPHSIRRYPDAAGVTARLRAAGFTDVRMEPQLAGLMTIHVARTL